MTRQKNDCLGLGDLPLWALLLKHLPWNRALLRPLFGPGKTFMPPGLTNMGPIARERLDFAGILPQQAFMTPSVIFAPNLVVGASGFGESLTLSIGFTGGAANRAVVEALS